MEANFFRHLMRELTPELRGSRVEKVYEPLAGIWTIKLSQVGHLLFIAGPKENGLCLSASKPENPASPSARARWWRKRLQNRRILGVTAHWPRRQVALTLSQGQGRYLLLDLASGPLLIDQLAQGFGEDPEWPDLDSIIHTENIFRDFPHISPLLRKSLASRKREECLRLLQFVQHSKPAIFYLYCSGTEREIVSIWPLYFPPEQSWEEKTFSSANRAALAYCWHMLQRREAKQYQPSSSRHKARRRVQKKLRQVEEDEQRLQEMASLQDSAVLLQMNLHQLGSGEKRSQAEVFDSSGSKVRLDLDPQLTVLQNMERMFARAGKGRRGLEHVFRRRQELEGELRELEQSEQSGVEKPLPESGPVKGTPRRQSSSAGRLKGLEARLFRSSDGFLILRGKNKRSNHKLLSQAARPFDLWFHAESGPGAHVVLQRDFEDQKVPRRSLEQAAVLAALASHQSRAAKAAVICARVKDVRKVKGADLGEVRVDAIQESLVVPVDAGLEDALRIEEG